MRKRINWIDAVKGTCLLLVVIAHLWHPCPTWTSVLTGGYMQVFFVMAGITSIASALTFREQIIQKCKRLLIPYALYGIILLVLGTVLPTNISFGKGLLGLLYGRYSVFPLSVETNMPLLQACGYLSPFWFLPCIFLSYVLLAWYDHSKRPQIVVLLAIIVGCITPLLPILLPWSIEMSFVGFLLMLCGRSLRNMLMVSPTRQDKQFYLQLCLWITCAIVYLIAWKVDNPINMSLSNMGNDTIPFMFRVVFFCLLGVSEAVFLSLSFKAVQGSILTRCMAYVGRHALRLLCIHLFIGQGVYFLMENISVPQAIRFACALAVILLIDYLLESASHLLQSALGKKSTRNISAEKH